MGIPVALESVWHILIDTELCHIGALSQSTLMMLRESGWFPGALSLPGCGETDTYDTFGVISYVNVPLIRVKMRARRVSPTVADMSDPCVATSKIVEMTPVAVASQMYVSSGILSPFIRGVDVVRCRHETCNLVVPQSIVLGPDLLIIVVCCSGFCRHGVDARSALG